MEKQIIKPKRIVRDFLSDSRVWSDFLSDGGFVEGDIVVVDPFKAGTTWTQRIVQQIIDNGKETLDDLSSVSVWLDSSFGNHDKMLKILKEQKLKNQRRIIKSHLPAYALPISSKARYIFIGRNGKDLVNSFYNYLKNFTPETLNQINTIYQRWSGKKLKLVIPESQGEFFNKLLETEGYNCCNLFDVVKSWWKYKNNSNVLFIHYSDLIHDLENQIIKIAEFIGADTNSLKLKEIKKHCDFYYMKQRASSIVPFGGKHMNDPRAFFHKGAERDFKKELSKEQIKNFDKISKKELGKECSYWLETGKLSK